MAQKAISKRTPISRLFFLICGTFLLVFNPSLSSQDANDEEVLDSFKQEFKKIFGQSRTLNLTARQYLQKLVAGEANDEEFLRQIKLLGSENYRERQNAEAFLFSVPILPEKYREGIERNTDMEVRYRLKSIFAHRKNRVESLTVAALKTIAEKNDGEALELVFQLNDLTESAVVKKTAVATIRAIANQSHKNLLLTQMKSEQVEKRLLCARLYVKLDLDEPIKHLGVLLEDEIESVRLEMSKVLVDLNHKPAIHTLIQLLKSESISIASRSERVLRAVAGEKFGNITFSDKTKNLEIANAWSKWETEKLASAKLNLPLKDYLKVSSSLNGHTLIAKDMMNVIELDENNKEIFRMTVSGVLSAEKTIDGNYLLFSYSSQWLREYSPEKKLLWEIKGLKFNNAMALNNGNVLVTIGPNSVTREIDPKTQKTVWEYKTGWWPNDAYRLENGNTLIGGKGGVIEVSPEKEVVWEYKNPDPGTIVVAKPTENDGIIVGWTNGLAREVDRDQNKIWEYKAAKLSDVFRDPNGHTLVATGSEIIELDPDKKVIWKYEKGTQTATVRR